MNTYTEHLLWTGPAPGSEGLAFDEFIDERSEDIRLYRDRAYSRILHPSLRVYRPAEANGLVMLVIPGGGYQRVVMDKEGDEIAPWLTALGITVCVLKYRLPAEGHANGTDVPLQDAQRALRWLRAHPEHLGCRAERVGVMGFSAGGHVAAMLATRFAAEVYAPRDAVDAQPARPDFAALVYPVITMDEDFTHAISRHRLLGDQPRPETVAAQSAELAVQADSVPCWIVHAGDDASVPVDNALRFYAALRRHGVIGELHVFERGGHGFAIRLATGPARQWTTLCEAWLRLHGWLAATA